MFEALGASAWRERAARELARTGYRETGDRLTPTERQVAELVAAGRTNREVAEILFMSPHTVEAHLTRIYRSLGVRGSHGAGAGPAAGDASGGDIAARRATSRRTRGADRGFRDSAGGWWAAGSTHRSTAQPAGTEPAMSQVISLRYPTSIHPFALVSGLVLVIGLVAVIGLGLAIGPERATAPTTVGSVSTAQIPMESEYLRSISAGWGTATPNAQVPMESEYLRTISADWGTSPVAAPVPLESEYLRSISAAWGTAPATPLESEYLRGIAAGW